LLLTTTTTTTTPPSSILTTPWAIHRLLLGGKTRETSGGREVMVGLGGREGLQRGTLWWNVAGTPPQEERAKMSPDI